MSANSAPGVLPAYGLALLRSGLSPCTGRAPDEPFCLRVPEFGYDVCGTLADRSVVSLLERVHTPTTGHVAPEGGEEETLVLLPANAWPHFPEARSAIAAFVLPRDLVVVGFSSGSTAGPVAGLRSAFERIAGKLAPHYREPERRLFGVDCSFQWILWPPEIALRSEATCLDLTLFLAGIVESGGDRPVVVFTGPRDGRPEHAFLGVWSGPGTVSVAGLGAGQLRDAVVRGNLVLVEATELCAGFSRSFDVAVERGRATALATDCHGIDVAAVRDYIPPLDLHHDPFVSLALGYAADHLNQKRLERRESSLLLLGLLQANGPVTRQIFRRIDLSSVSADLQELLPKPAPVTTRPRTTAGYERIIRAAKEFAESVSSSRIREVDLLRAVFENSAQGSKIRWVLTKHGVTWPFVMAELAVFYPSSDESTVADSSTWV